MGALWTRTSVSLISAFLCSCVVASNSGSSGGGGGGGSGDNVVPSDPKAPFGSVSPRTTFSMRGKYPFVSANRFFSGIIGSKIVGGQSFDIFKAGYDIAGPTDLGKADTKGARTLMRKPSPTQLTFAGVEDPGFTTVTLDPPVTFDLRPPVGEKKTYQGSGTFQLMPTDAPLKATATLDLTLVGESETVETAVGVVHNTRHFKGALTLVGEGVPPALATDPIAGEVWEHPELGVVAVDVPLLGAHMGWEGEQDHGPATSGPNYCKKSTILDDSVPSMTLSTYDRANKFDADKMTHAKMFLEFRFANPEEAKQKTLSDAKMVNVQFATATGYYNHTLLESPISLLHPEENGKGYKFFWAYVDQAAKNEPGSNGIAYKVSVSKPVGTAPVKVSARILYNLLP